MILRTGDKVRFLNDTGTGIIAGFKNKNTALVSIEEGFDIPMPITELVPIYDPAAKNDVKTVEEEPIPASNASGKVKKLLDGPEAILLGMVPENGVFSDSFRLVIINNSNYMLGYALSFRLKSQATLGIKAETLQQISYADAGVYGSKEIAEWDHIIVQLILHKQGLFRTQIPQEKQVTIKNGRLQQTHLLKPLPLNGQQSHIFELVDFKESPGIDYADYEPTFRASMLRTKAQRDKAQEDDKNPIRVNPKNGYMEIDLHIEELTDGYGGLSNGEIVQIQLNHCKKALDKAIQKRAGKITLIHGVGNGTLKREVRNLLTSYGGLQFYDAPAEKYGYGATEVILK